MSNFLICALNILLLSSLPTSVHTKSKDKNDNISKGVVSRTITVDKSGRGDFITVQQAIDSVPNNNNQWILIHIKAAIYNEKVRIEEDKQFIIIEGEGMERTVIYYEDGGNSIDSSTVKFYANNFVARDITFHNTYNRALVVKGREVEKRAISWAPAALVGGDKAKFIRCGFISLQDTLSDLGGRHYYHSCYIEGAVDFIWGNAQSFFKKCTLNVTTWALGSGGTSYMTAQGRDGRGEGTGFVFHSSTVVGTGPTFLGRAYRNFSRVVYYETEMPNIITPTGWDAWFNVGHENLITYAEVRCSGPGADKSKRVKWEKKLPNEELHKLINIDQFINQDGWLQQQP